SGVIRSHNGLPVAGVPVQGFVFDETGKVEVHPQRRVVTAKDGRYRLGPLPKGDYAIGVNADKFLDESPWRAAFFGADSAGNPARVHLDQGGQRDGVNLTLGTPRTPSQVVLFAVLPNGEPSRCASVEITSSGGLQQLSFFEGGGDATTLELYVGESYEIRCGAP